MTNPARSYRAKGYLAVVLLLVVTGILLTACGRTPASAAAAGGAQPAAAGQLAVMKDGYQEVVIDLKARSYDEITVQKGTPVHFVIRAEEAALNSCNNAVVIPAYDVRKDLAPGENLIAFTPDETGDVPYSCWMGMINSTIHVVDALDAPGVGAQTQPSESQKVLSDVLPGGCMTPPTADAKGTIEIGMTPT